MPRGVGLSRRLLGSLLWVALLIGCGPGAAAPDGASEPVGLQQLASVIDLAKLPMIDGATSDQLQATSLQCKAPVPVREAADFYVKKLATMGWRPSQEPGGNTVTDGYAAVSLMKDGYLLSLSVMPGDTPKDSRVMLENHGNLDTRTLPRVEKAEDVFGSQITTIYFTPAKVAETSDVLRRVLTAAGWQEYDLAHSQKADNPDFCAMTFRKKACSLSVAVSNAPAKPGRTSVQYAVSAFAHEMPAPADARHVEVQDRQWYLTCEIPRDLAAVAEYYRAAMPDVGFKGKPHETPIDKNLTMSFRSETHDVVLVELKPLDERSTQVTLRGFSAATIAEAEKPQSSPATPQAAPTVKQLEKQLPDEIEATIDKAVDDAMSGNIKSESDANMPDVQEAVRQALDQAGKASNNDAEGNDRIQP